MSTARPACQRPRRAIAPPMTQQDEPSAKTAPPAPPAPKITVVETALGATASPTLAPLHPPEPSSAPAPKTKSLASVLCQRRWLMRYFYRGLDFVAQPSTKISSDDAFHILLITLSQLATFLPLRIAPLTFSSVHTALLLFWPLGTFARIHLTLHTLWPSPNDGLHLFYTSFIALFTLTFSLTAPTAFTTTRVITAVSAFLIIVLPSLLLLLYAWREPLLKDVSNRANQIVLYALIHAFVSTPYLATIFVSPLSGVKALYWAAFAASLFAHIAPHALFFWMHRGNKREQTHIPPRLTYNQHGYGMLSLTCFAAACMLLLIHGIDLTQQLSKNTTHMYAVAVLAFLSLLSLHNIHLLDISPVPTPLPTSFAAITSTFLFAPLHFFVFLLSVSYAKLMTVASDPTSDLTFSLRKLVSVSWTAAIIITTVLAALQTRLRDISRIIRLSVRLIIAVILGAAMPFSDMSVIVFILVFTLILIVITIIDFVLARYESHSIAPFVTNGQQFTTFRPYEEPLPQIRLEPDADVSDLIRELESKTDGRVRPHLDAFRQRLLANKDIRLMPVATLQDTLADASSSVRDATRQVSESDSRHDAVIVVC